MIATVREFIGLALVTCVGAHLTGCSLTSRSASFDTPVHFNIVMHEDGWCRVTIFGRELEVIHDSEFDDWRSEGLAHGVSCGSVKNILFNRKTMVEARILTDDNANLSIYLTQSTENRSTRIIKEPDASLFFTLSGKGSMGRFFCTTYLQPIELSLIHI